VQLNLKEKAPATLQLDMESGERLEPEQIMHHSGRVGVVSAVVELLHCARRVLKMLVPVTTPVLDNRRPSIKDRGQTDHYPHYS